MRINYSTCSLFMGILWELNFSEINQIMHLFRWEMVFKQNWLYTFWRCVSDIPSCSYIMILDFCDIFTQVRSYYCLLYMLLLSLVIYHSFTSILFSTISMSIFVNASQVCLVILYNFKRKWRKLEQNHISFLKVLLFSHL